MIACRTSHLACEHCCGYADRQKGGSQLADCARLISDQIVR
jgi:hypothetical protein